MDQPIISIQNLQRFFGTLTAIDGLSFDVRKDEKLALIVQPSQGHP